MSKHAARPFRRLAQISFGLIALVFALVAVTAIYGAVATAYERARFPPPGRLVDVCGYRLHLRCEGQGSPTVVLESRSGMTSNEWTRVQPEVAKFTRICSYDRAALGWSESGPPADAVEVLHTLLRNGAVFVQAFVLERGHPTPKEEAEDVAANRHAAPYEASTSLRTIESIIGVKDNKVRSWP